MRHPIDPKIDCVFKALLGSEDNRALLIHFLNAMLGETLPSPVTDVVILNPYNEREFLDDKLSIVDVKARDERGRLYQIEIQLLAYRDLPARILYAWTDLYSQQLHSGQDYSALQPTFSIWLLAEDLLPDEPAYLHRYWLRDDRGRALVDHGGIWLVELNKFHAEQVETEQHRWLKFLNEGERLDADDLPSWMQTNEMRQAMSTLKAFSEKERAYHAYQARQNFLRQQQSIERELEAAHEREKAALQRAEAERKAKEAEREAKEAEREAKEAEREAKEAAVAEKEAALAEIERLKAQLRDQ
jgi:predicted transposase/invertase (TIGR01784 family)